MSVIGSRLLAGARLSITAHSPAQPEFWDRLAATKATSLAGVPFHYDMLRRSGTAKLDLPHIGTLTQAGGKLAPRVVKLFADWARDTGRRFFVIYGQTEAGPRFAFLPPGRAVDAPESVAASIAGVELRHEDVTGELVCVPAGVMMGGGLDTREVNALPRAPSGKIRYADLAASWGGGAA